MKDFVERARRISRTLAGRIRRAVDPPLAADATPLELRHFIVEAVEARVQAAGAGRRALPDSYIVVKVVASDSTGQRALRTTLDGLQPAIAARLGELRCDLPRDFRVEVIYLKRPPATWAEDQQVAIEYPEPRRLDEAAKPSETPAPLRITVVRGTAAQSSYTFSAPIVRVGRSEAPHDDRGRARRNDVAFLENEDEHNQTVTRGHCEIRYSRQTGEYRIFDERSANGTRIVRGGQVIEVPAGDPIGVAIQSGDELQFGNASVRVSIATIKG